MSYANNTMQNTTIPNTYVTSLNTVSVPYTNYSYIATAPNGHDCFQQFVDSYFKNNLLTIIDIHGMENTIDNLLKSLTNEWLNSSGENFNNVLAYNEYKNCHTVDHKIDHESSSVVVINGETFHYCNVQYNFISTYSVITSNAKLIISHKDFLKIKLTS